MATRRTAIGAALISPIAGCATLGAIGKATGIIDAQGHFDFYAMVRGIAAASLDGLAIINPPGAALIEAAIKVAELALNEFQVAQTAENAATLATATRKMGLACGGKFTAISNLSEAARVVRAHPEMARARRA